MEESQKQAMIDAYKKRLLSQANGMEKSVLMEMCLTAFRHGVENTLAEVEPKQQKLKQLADDPTEIITDVPEAGQGEWQPNKVYKNGDRVNCNGVHYECQGEFKPTDISGKVSWKDNAVRIIDRLISWMIYAMTFCLLFGVAGLDLSVREIIAYSLMLGLVVGSINNIERVMRELFKKEG